MRRLDLWLVLAVLFIAAASFLAQSSTAQALERPTLAYRQMVWLLVAVGMMVVVGMLDYRVIARFWPPLYAGSLLVLAITLLVAPLRAGTRSWLVFGTFTVQPSEFARVVVLVALAAVAATHQQGLLSTRKSLELVALAAVPMGLVLLQPDLGVALSFLPALAAVFWLGGLRLRVWLLLAVVAVATSVLVFFALLKPYQKERILTFLEPERAPYTAGYQQRQAKIAVGSGGLTGKGLKSGTQSQLRFLPAQGTDFIFAVWAEETGFVGSLSLLFAYGLLLFRIFYAGLLARDRLGLLLCGGVGAVLGAQVLVNIGMNLGLAPTTGITLPLLSYGGSSTLATGLALGLVQSVWRLRFANL
ncbi:MAG: rod shape-determining protein RodA [Thermoanaerobaculum sp.]|nr:rod shape-determining protein RodA [Thermoanaerobaculum sp.]MDW7967508.1 rod shape-determining protein RodA [Thermoanaerobaculum sp.]